MDLPLYTWGVKLCYVTGLLTVISLNLTTQSFIQAVGKEGHPLPQGVGEGGGGGTFKINVAFYSS